MNDAIYAMMKRGAEVQKAGGMAVPAHDPQMLPALKGKSVGEGLKLLDAWTTGWHMANLGQDL